MTATLPILLLLLAAGDGSSPEEVLKQALAATRSLRGATFRLRREMVDSEGRALPDSGALNAEVSFRRDRALGESDPYAVGIRFRATGDVPSSLPGNEAEGPDEIAFDGTVLRVRNPRVLLEMPLSEASVSVWETAESAVLIGGLADPGYLDLHPEARVKDLGSLTIDGTVCRGVETAFPIVKCLPGGTDPRDLGFELFDDAKDGPPGSKGRDDGASDPSQTVCYRVRVRVRLWISNEDHLVRRVAIPAYGVGSGKVPWQQDTILSLAPNPKLDDAVFALKARSGERVERLSPQEVALNLGTPEQLSKMQRGADGEPAPDFELKDPAGKTTKLSTLKGEVVLLDFWGTWCGPCVAFLPEVQKIHADFSPHGLVVLGIACGEKDLATPKRVMQQQGCTYRLLLGGDAVASAYGILGYPTLVLIGRDGTIRFVHTGGGGDAAASLRTAVEAALKEQRK